MPLTDDGKSVSLVKLAEYGKVDAIFSLNRATNVTNLKF